MTGWGRLAALLGALLATAPARAAPPTLSVSAAALEVVQTRPGGVVTAAILIENLGTAPATVQEHHDLPEGWRPLTPAGRFTLEAGARTTRLAGVAVPPDATPGRYALGFGAASAEDPSRVYEWVVFAEVPRVDAVEVDVLTAPTPLFAGERGGASLWVANRGNAPARVELSARPDDALRVRFDPPALELPAAGGAEVRVEFEAARATHRVERRAILVRAAAPGLAHPAGAVMWVAVAPRGRPTLAAHHTLPVRLTASAVQREGVRAVIGEIEATGPLDHRGRVHLDLGARGPGRGAADAFGLRDEVRAVLTTPVLDVAAGDLSWPTPWLLGPNRRARGLGLTAHLGPVDLGAHRTGSLGADRPMTETAARARLHEGDPRGDELVAQVVHRAAPGEPGDLIAGLAGHAAHLGPVQLTGELAGHGAPDGPALAGRATIAARAASGLTFAGTKVRASPAFRGVARDRDTTLLSATVPLGRDASARALLSHERDNLHVDPAERVAPRATRAGALVRVAAADGFSLRLGADAAHARDALDADQRWTEALGLLATRWEGEHLRVDLQGRLGRHLSPKHPAGDAVFDHAGSITILPVEHLALTAFGAWSGGPTGARDRTPSGTQWGLRGAWTPGPHARVDASLLQVAFIGARPRLRADATARWTADDGLTVGLRARYLAGDGGFGVDRAVMLWVSAPLAVPLARRDDVGALRGRLVDEADPRRGLAGVRVQAGDALAITDRRGRFAFAALPPGPREVDVDVGDLEARWIATEPLPRAVRVEAGKIGDLSLAFAPAGAIRGTVAVDAAPLPGIRVVLAHPSGERLVARTDADGAFGLGGLRPGAWTATPLPADLPAWHRAAPAPTLEVRGGATARAELRVERVERPIRLLEPPPVAIAPPPGPPPPSTPPRRREPPPTEPTPPPPPPPLRSPAEVDALISEVLPPQSDAHGADPPETACFDALGCVWVLPDDWRGARPIDLPALTRRELSRVLADPVSFCTWNPCVSE